MCTIIRVGSHGGPTHVSKSQDADKVSTFEPLEIIKTGS